MKDIDCENDAVRAEYRFTRRMEHVVIAIFVLWFLVFPLVGLVGCLTCAVAGGAP